MANSYGRFIDDSRDSSSARRLSWFSRKTTSSLAGWTSAIEMRGALLKPKAGRMELLRLIDQSHRGRREQRANDSSPWST